MIDNNKYFLLHFT